MNRYIVVQFDQGRLGDNSQNWWLVVDTGVSPMVVKAVSDVGPAAAAYRDVLNSA